MQQRNGRKSLRETFFAGQEINRTTSSQCTHKQKTSYRPQVETVKPSEDSKRKQEKKILSSGPGLPGTESCLNQDTWWTYDYFCLKKEFNNSDSAPGRPAKKCLQFLVQAAAESAAKKPLSGPPRRKCDWAFEIAWMANDFMQARTASTSIASLLLLVHVCLLDRLGRVPLRNTCLIGSLNSLFLWSLDTSNSVKIPCF
ncbi:hypothetical protein SELMODRAFT_416387 [Selaginella moellendorffii]|uniref:Uncharacterized protein n=1 Tax=Selaginella moellendorffii TaxID=88036 RepID=D8RZ47_SELML|nr:hypothetical protein SELMODRAFT_416387 [Selaginella moellendorffii]